LRPAFSPKQTIKIEGDQVLAGNRLRRSRPPNLMGQEQTFPLIAISLRRFRENLLIAGAAPNGASRTARKRQLRSKRRGQF
jgi:hypothetical protein